MEKLPQIKTALPGPEAQRTLALDRQYVSPSYTRDYPLVARRGEGMMVEDVDGNVFLDFSAGIAVVRTRARPLGMEVVVGPAEEAPARDCFAALLQYPGANGVVREYRPLVEALHALGPLERLAIMYTGNREPAEAMHRKLAGTAELPDMPLVEATPAIGTHIGPDAVGFAAIKKNT